MYLCHAFSSNWVSLCNLFNCVRVGKLTCLFPCTVTLSILIRTPTHTHTPLPQRTAEVWQSKIKRKFRASLLFTLLSLCPTRSPAASCQAPSLSRAAFLYNLYFAIFFYLLALLLATSLAIIICVLRANLGPKALKACQVPEQMEEHESTMLLPAPNWTRTSS